MAQDIGDKYWKEYWDIKARYLPDSKNCQEQYEDLVERFLNNDTLWLDAGCGHILLHHWNKEKEKRFAGTARMIVGLDGDFSGISKNQVVSRRLLGNLESLPLKSNCFTLITCNMVMEHIGNPAAFIKEVERILKPGGVAIIHTINRFHWEPLLAYCTPHKFHEIACRIMYGREGQDVYPIAYRANTLGKLTGLFRDSGMVVETGGRIIDSPKRWPIPVVHRILHLLSIVEVKLLRLKVLAFFRHNLLIAFRKPIR